MSKGFLAIILFFSSMTFARNFQWKDRITLMSHDMPHLDNSSRAHHLYAMHLAQKAQRAEDSTEANKEYLRQAVLHVQKALEIYPYFPYAWHDLAKIYFRLGERENAISAYQKSVNKDSLFALPCFEVGLLLNEAGRLAEAERAYRLAIGRDSFMLKAYTNLSFLLYRQDRYEESIAINLLALRHLPDTYEVYVNIGKTYAKMRDLSNALVYLEKATSINNSDKSLLSYIAGVYETQGDKDKAAFYRTRAAPGSP